MTFEKLVDVCNELYNSTTGPGVSWAWDKAGRKLSETTGTLALSIAYDADGNRASLTWPDGGSLAYMFSGADRFVQVGDTGGKAGVSLVYDPLGRLTSLTRLTAHATSIAYDAADRLTGLAQTFAGGVGNVAWTYAYTPAGQIASSGASTGQLDWAGSASSSVNKTFDGLNRDSTVTALSGGYDANENLTFDGTRTFAYDGDNRLVTESAAGTSTTLGYDPTGRLETQSTTIGGTTTQTTYLYDGDALVAEYNGSGILLRRYAHGPGVDNPLIWYEGASLPAADARYLIADRQGTVIGYSDTTGAVPSPSAVYSYDAYGAPSAWGGSRFRYTGQIEIPEVQLYDYKARAYDPLFGHFLQTDPIGQKDDPNLYAYVKDDPTNKADPTGLQVAELAGAGCAITVEVGCAPGAAVGAVVGGAIVVGGAACGASEACRDFVRGIFRNDEAKPPPNPDGSKGGREHQDKIKGRIEELKGEGKGHVAGGDKPEERVDTPGGEKGSRRPDITMENPDGSKYRENVGRQNKDGSPVARERRAREDIERATGQCNFSPYCK